MNSEEFKQKLNKIKLLIMDVDGTLTDSAMFYSKNGEELKRFSTRDGMGITLLQLGGIDSAIITSENSDIALARANKLKIHHIILGSHNKINSIIELAEKLSISLENIAYIGDDVNDAQAMKICGATACPNDAVNHIKQIVDYICSHNGGNGAVREFAELILESQNKQLTLPEN